MRNSDSWPDERAAILGRIVIDRGLGVERKPHALPSGSGETGGRSKEISIASRGEGKSREDLSVAIGPRTDGPRSYVSPPKLRDCRPSLHKRNAKIRRVRARAFRVARVAAFRARNTRDVGARHQRHALHNDHVFFFSLSLSPRSRHAVRNGDIDSGCIRAPRRTMARSRLP